jgi:hypothetical protein
VRDRLDIFRGIFGEIPVHAPRNSYKVG